MGRKSRVKGKVGEREAAEVLSEVLGIPFRRGQQFRGGTDSPDVVPCDVDIGLHIEVKRTEALNLYGAMEQASRDAGSDQVPVVIHRRNSKDWVVISRLRDLIALCEAVLAVKARRDIELVYEEPKT